VPLSGIWYAIPFQFNISGKTFGNDTDSGCKLFFATFAALRETYL
jgi:hypothetical protein